MLACHTGMPVNKLILSPSRPISVKSTGLLFLHRTRHRRTNTGYHRERAEQCARHQCPHSKTSPRISVRHHQIEMLGKLSAPAPLAVRLVNLIVAVLHMLDQPFLREAIECTAHFGAGAFVAPLQIDLLQPGSRQQNARQNILPDIVRHIARVGTLLLLPFIAPPPSYCAGSSIAQSSPPVHSPERVR